jgi:hypothetical protein
VAFSWWIEEVGGVTVVFLKGRAELVGKSGNVKAVLVLVAASMGLVAVGVG